jgi:NTP pyrophosphatase (non-canonical NTP hydrolase)
MKTMESWNFRNLQDEQAPWVLKNFGKRPPWQPLLGIAEELGELHQALELDTEDTDNSEEIKDAIADTVIFMADFCTSQSFDLEDLYRLSIKSQMRDPMVNYARIAHSFLKKSQGIRGTPEEHDRAARDNLIELLSYLRHVAMHRVASHVHDITREVWERVRQRDWKKNAATGAP